MVISTTAATSPSKWHEVRLGCNECEHFTVPVDSSTCFHNLCYLVRKQSLNLGQDVSTLLKYFPESGSALLAPGASARTAQIVACKSPAKASLGKDRQALLLTGLHTAEDGTGKLATESGSIQLNIVTTASYSYLTVCNFLG